jgi:hypothetical protein
MSAAIRSTIEYRYLFLAVAALIFACACRIQAAQPPGEDSSVHHFENENVSIAVKVHSGVYTYRVTNLTNSPIVEFKVVTPAAFAILVPSGWDKDITREFLQATVGKGGSAIPPQATGSFQLYAIGKGSVLGTAPIQLGLESGQTCTIDEVWAPVLEPRYYTWLVVAGLLVIMVAHTTLIVRKDRRRKNSDH